MSGNVEVIFVPPSAFMTDGCGTGRGSSQGN